MAPPAAAASPLRDTRSAGLAWPRRRACGGAEALARVAPCFDRLGITRLARITHLDHVGIPVWTAVRPNGRTLSVSQGKGIDDDAARISAAMEAIELATAEEPPVAAFDVCADALARGGRRPVHLARLLRRGRPVDPWRQQDWADAFDLETGQPLLVPIDAVRIDDAAERDGDHWQSTDGLAAGITLAEAVLQGVLEQIERDATVLSRFWPRAAFAARCFAAESLPPGPARTMAARIESAGLRLRLFDVTSDLGLPVCTAIIGPADRRARRNLEIASGAGCHLTVEGAAARAIAEAAQSRLTAIAGLRDDIAPCDYAASVPTDVAEDLAAEPNEALPPRGQAHAPVQGWEDLLARFAAAGLGRTIVVPLSRPGDPFVVTKVFVEGLESPDGDRERPLGLRAALAMAGVP